MRYFDEVSKILCSLRKIRYIILENNYLIGGITMTTKRFMLDLDGITISAEEKDIIQHPLVGGLIFFTRNYHSLEQLTQLITDVRALVDEDFLISVDHEGGRVQRFRHGFTKLPALAHLGRLYADDATSAKSLTQQHGWLMAAELRSMDIDFSFAPVLDLDNGTSTVIGDRSFHDDEQIVSALASDYIQGMRQAGMASTGKHFPGHGAIVEDTHKTIAIDNRSKQAIWDKDIKPFQQLIKQGLDAVMPAHVIYPNVDDQPAGFSQIWVKDILRQQLEFNGVVFSDDLTMEGASVVGGFAERAEAAIAAGCDMFLACNNREGAIDILDNVKLQDDQTVKQRLQAMKGKPFMTHSELIQQEKWQQAVKDIRRIEEATA